MHRLYLHIGLHKTGTSAIQRTMTNNRSALGGAGIRYPERGCPAEGPRFGHHELAWQVLGLRGADDPGVWPGALEEIDRTGAAVGVLSSEAFDRCERPHIDTIRSLLGDRPTTVVVYIRNEAAFLTSKYRQHLARGFAGSFREFVDQRGDRWDHARIARDWQAGFGSEHLAVRVYDRAAAEGGVEADFLTVIGAPAGLDLRLPSQPTHPSMTDAGAVAMRRVNRALGPFTGLRARVSSRLRGRLQGRGRPEGRLPSYLRMLGGDTLVDPADIEWLRSRRGDAPGRAWAAHLDSEDLAYLQY